mmetsp:Transcript_27486/g.67851  ORF Transcript_27486/g.67851 Transcript_27486/m.67851 type:complete len:210 (+) Transcript_27486:141-770(+)
MRAAPRRPKVLHRRRSGRAGCPPTCSRLERTSSAPQPHSAPPEHPSGPLERGEGVVGHLIELALRRHELKRRAVELKRRAVVLLLGPLEHRHGLGVVALRLPRELVRVEQLPLHVPVGLAREHEHHLEARTPQVREGVGHGAPVAGRGRARDHLSFDHVPVPHQLVPHQPLPPSHLLDPHSVSLPSKSCRGSFPGTGAPPSRTCVRPGP